MTRWSDMIWSYVLIYYHFLGSDELAPPVRRHCLTDASHGAESSSRRMIETRRRLAASSRDRSGPRATRSSLIFLYRKNGRHSVMTTPSRGPSEDFAAFHLGFRALVSHISTCFNPSTAYTGRCVVEFSFREEVNKRLPRQRRL